ncbi:radical SAM protein [Methanocella sp. CWC-04]|uniref:Radical SAM protein n=1 Tax=Methanooceanicella nereidis TaxID=2052831 RepID=A0AAP2W7T6_9EURY|nr:radical SAM protein [Methanocella sp. CWC-04]
MNKLEEDGTGSAHTKLCEGCRLCHQGAKMVLFITGICSRDCFYCPLSEERKGKDVVYANEKVVRSDADVIAEARQMDALGTGITGGEPLIRLDRTIHYIRLLKNAFGKQHHIHLYTSTAPDIDVLEKLKNAGLDEIRFHPPEDEWDDFRNTRYYASLKAAKEAGMDAGIEIPAIKSVPEIEKAVKDVGGFLNLNELEFSDTNCDAMRARGYELRDDISNAVRGSEQTGYEIVLNTIANTRYCSSRFKDAIQLRERLKRIARNVARPFDEISDDGTIIYGEITGNIAAALKLIMEVEVPSGMYEYNEDTGRIEIAWWILEDIAEDLGGGIERSIVERYPFENGLVVERIPL